MPKNILIFDTETTGLLPKTPTDPNPYLTQLSFAVYDLEHQILKSEFNAYIKLPPNIVVPEIVTQITGITTEICQTQGIPIQEALGVLFHSTTLCDCIIAHNISFDMAIINIEVQRNLSVLEKRYPQIADIFDNDRLAYYDIKTDCTMKMTVDQCAIYRTTDKNYTYKKYPKLIETYEFLFKKSAPENLHNSMIDVLVCLRCYLKIKYNIDITDERFELWIKTSI
jgi:DNA polymerase III epsilon subunit-like protein